MLLRKLMFVFGIMILLYSCSQENTAPTDEFMQTWYAGKAEITNYTLQQARYGELRDGEANLIFVTEDFSTDKLVKLDAPESASNKVRVLKMNMTKKFITGLYPYSMMLSAFSPVDRKGKNKALKISCSSQEWCGHTFSQLSLKGKKYKWELHSYFEKEGEQAKTLEADFLEDELWNRIRINPVELPQGKLNIMPGLLWQRLSHKEIKAEEAVLTLSAADSFLIKEANTQMYTIHYPLSLRTLKIYFQPEFPYTILGWQESYPDGFGEDKKMLTTIATRKTSIWLDYWKRNGMTDSTYRDTLQLKRYE